jgi:ABC-2 type transport system ATP-binding protein
VGDATAALEVESVVKRYGDRLALDGVSLRVEPGEVCGLLGPNGAGKTTLVSIIAGLREADSVA